MNAIFKTVLYLFLFSRNYILYADSNEEEYRYLDQLALSLDSSCTFGKGSNWHNYTEVYAQTLQR